MLGSVHNVNQRTHGTVGVNVLDKRKPDVRNQLVCLFMDEYYGIQAFNSSRYRVITTSGEKMYNFG